MPVHGEIASRTYCAGAAPFINQALRSGEDLRLGRGIYPIPSRQTNWAATAQTARIRGGDTVIGTTQANSNGPLDDVTVRALPPDRQ